MKIGLMNDPAKDPASEIRRIAAAGFDFVDLTLEGPASRLAEPSALKPVLDETGLFVVGHTDPCLPWAYPVPEVREACLAELTRNAEVLAALGAKVMNIHPCYFSPVRMRDRMVDLNAEALPEIAARVESLGLTLMLENFVAPFNSTAVFRRLMEAAPNLFLHLDFGHTNMGGDPAPAFLEALGNRLAHVHFSDNRGNADHHMPLGVGTVPWREMVKALKSTGYDGTITLEVFCENPEMRLSYCRMNRDHVRDLWNQP